MNLIPIQTASSTDHFESIVALQKLNVAQSLSPEETTREGFVTLQHTVEILELMNVPYPHIIATDRNSLVGYALVTLREHIDALASLQDIIEVIHRITYDHKTLADSKYFIMGQICIAKAYRGQGIFKLMYDRLASQMKTDFDYMVTIISNKNQRSVRAHEKIGFQTIHQDNAIDRDWVIVLKDLR